MFPVKTSHEHELLDGVHEFRTRRSFEALGVLVVSSELRDRRTTTTETSNISERKRDEIRCHVVDLILSLEKRVSDAFPQLS